MGDSAAELLAYLVESVHDGWILPDRQVESVLCTLQAAEQAHWKDRLAAVQQSTGDQVALLADYRPLTSGGHPDQGRAAFFGKGACSACHRVEAKEEPSGRT